MIKTYLEDICGDEDPVYLRMEDLKRSMGLSLLKHVGKPFSFNTLDQVNVSLNSFLTIASLEEQI